MVELTQEELEYVTRISQEKIAQKHSDKNTHSYGARGEQRTPEKELEHNVRGVAAEMVAAKATKSIFQDARRQYYTKKPDGICTYKGRLDVPYDVRGGKKAVAYRPGRDEREHKPDDILVGVVGSDVGHITFGKLKDAADKHPEWRGFHPGAPYYDVPIEYFDTDFSDFGDKQ